MCTFYGFNFRFCNARAGWDKGLVERSVDYVCGRAFTTRINFDSVEAARQRLSRICEGINRETGSIASGKNPEALRRDIDAMLHFPGDFGCFDMMACSVDKQSTICVKGCHYSVPDSLVGQTVTVQLYSEKLHIYDTDHKVLKDKVLCAAIVDRLCHKSYLINMTGTSYRIKETKKLTKKI